MVLKLYSHWWIENTKVYHSHALSVIQTIMVIRRNAIGVSRYWDTLRQCSTRKQLLEYLENCLT